MDRKNMGHRAIVKTNHPNSRRQLPTGESNYRLMPTPFVLF
ncbi:MAG TPA: hypothetical protein VIW74_04215 [Pyrinomonadaceae bacterium]